MQQLDLFSEYFASKKEQEINDTFQQEIARTLGVQYGPAWTDHFGQQLRHWFYNSEYEPIATLSLFSGGGGLDIGFTDAGFHSLEMVELERKYVQTLEVNAKIGKVFSDVNIVCSDIRDYTPDQNLRVDFIIGGPPCQTFSAAGRRAAGVSGTDDPRGTLFEEYVRILVALQPKGFLFENVYGLTGAQNGIAWDDVKSAFKSAGYNIQYRILDAADYGVPQHRERVFIIGLKEGEFLFPRPTHGPDSRCGQGFFPAGIAVEGVDLSDADAGLGGKYGHLLDDIPPGLNYSFYTEKMGHPRPIFGWRSKFSDFLYKADPDTPVRTIKAQGGQYTGPFSWENRPFTVAELKRLQTIPDDYKLVGNRQVCIEQIGNSVPPQLARILALSVLNQVFGITLPFSVEYLHPNEKLHFRQRKRQKTDEYSHRARTAISLAQPVDDKQDENMCSHQTIRYLANNFAWLKMKQDNTFGIRIHYELTDSSWIVYAQSLNEELDFYNSYSIDITPSNSRSWILPVPRVSLVGGDFSETSFTALWKAFEEILVEHTGIADLIQLSGYYQYSPKIRIRMRHILPYPSYLWHVLEMVVKGVGVAKQLSVSEFREVFGRTDDMFAYFENLRRIGYEVRNSNTNSQIKKDVFLIPYAFPTLTPRSVQLRKKLR